MLLDLIGKNEKKRKKAWLSLANCSRVCFGKNVIAKRVNLEILIQLHFKSPQIRIIERWKAYTYNFT